MGLYTYIHVHQDENVVFDDLTKLNDELAEGEVSELIDNLQEATPEQQATFTGFIKQEGGSITFANFADGYYEGYESEYVMVYGCFDEPSMKVIAKHMTSGKLVLRKEVEGNPGFYFVITHGDVKIIPEKSVKF